MGAKSEWEYDDGFFRVLNPTSPGLLSERITNR